MTVLIEIAPVGSCGDWDGLLDPVIVPKPERRPGGADWILLSRERVVWPQGRIIVHPRQVHGIPAPDRDTISQTRARRVAGGSASVGEHATGCVEPAASGGLSRYVCAQRSVTGGCATPRRVCFHAVIGVSVETGEGNILGPSGRRRCRGNGASCSPLGVLHAEVSQAPS